MIDLHFGLKPARPEAIKLKFSAALPSVALPKPPAIMPTYGPALRQVWQMLGNDQCGDCVLAGAAHEHMLWAALGRGTPPLFTSASVIQDYSEVTGYDPNKPSTDNGTDIQEAAAYRLKTGIMDSVGNTLKIDAYAALDPGNLDEIALCCALFGACGLGIQVPSSAIDQFDRMETWNDNQTAEIAGEHYVPCVGRNSLGNWLIVTWGRLHAATPAFIARYMTQGVAYIDFAAVHALSPALEANLRAQLAEITTNPVTSSTKEAMSVATKTTPATTAAERVLAAQAVREVLAARIPSWEQSLIPQDVLEQGIEAAVAAIDDFRDANEGGTS